MRRVTEISQTRWYSSWCHIGSLWCKISVRCGSCARKTRLGSVNLWISRWNLRQHQGWAASFDSKHPNQRKPLQNYWAFYIDVLNYLFLFFRTSLSKPFHTSSERIRDKKTPKPVMDRLCEVNGLRIAVEGCVSLFEFIACFRLLIFKIGSWNTTRNLCLCPRGRQNEWLEWRWPSHNWRGLSSKTRPPKQQASQYWYS